MTIVNGYATLDEAKSWISLRDGDDDQTLETVITAVSRWIDNYCNRHFWQETATAHRFDSPDGVCVTFGPMYDLAAITTLKSDDDNDGVFEVTWSAADYQLLPLNVSAPETRPYTELRSVGNRWFPWPWSYPSRVGRIEITGTWGWSAIPTAVNEACRLQVARVFKRKQSPEGVAGWGDFGPIRISGRLDPDVAELLGDYRLLSVLVA